MPCTADVPSAVQAQIQSLRETDPAANSQYQTAPLARARRPTLTLNMSSTQKRHVIPLDTQAPTRTATRPRQARR